MAELSKKLLDMLTEFMLCEIGSKSLDGITYALLTKSNKDKETVSRYKEIIAEKTRCGYNDRQIFRVYEISNGYIFDMDMDIVKQLTHKIAKSLSKTNPGSIADLDLIKDLPTKRRNKDLVGLSKYIVNQFKEGKTQIEVALFSKNSTNRIMIHGKGPNGEPLAIAYYAYAIRHWDIEILNAKLLIPQGLRISRIQPCEVLPPKTGVSFLFNIEPM